MMYWLNDYGMGHGLGWIFMILFWVVVFLLIFYFTKQLSKGTPHSKPDGEAEEILKQRYAKGEINREEFERMKEDIRS